MRHRSFFLMIAVVLLIGAGLSTAQSYTLGGLAGESDLYFGTAAWTHHLEIPELRETVIREFTMFVPEHEAKWCMLSEARGVYDFTNFDALVDFAEENSMAIRGHTLVWHQCSPAWVENADWSREEAIEVLREHITTVVSRYKGRIAYWDVINEGIDDSGMVRETAWSRMIGEDYIEMAFQFAHEADPDALLYYNDYNIENMGTKSDAVYDMAVDFLERGIPIHGIGWQGHFTLGSVNIASMTSNMERLAELGLEVQMTEVDVKYEGEPEPDTFEVQAAIYYRTLELCLDSEACTAYVVWGVTDAFTWLRNVSFCDCSTVEPLLFDANYRPKRAYYAVIDLLARRAGVISIMEEEDIEEILATLGGEAAPGAVLPPPIMTDPNQLAPDSVAGEVVYAPFPVAITLDGDLGDWENIPRTLVDSYQPGPGAESYEFAVAADDTNLYFMANVTDSNLVYGQYGVGEWYREDSVEFYLNTTGDLGASSYAPGIVQIGMLAENVTGPDAPLVGGGNSGDSQVDLVAVETDTGYIIEASVPLVTDVWAIVPEHLGVLGFQTHLNGSSSDDRDTKLIWSVADTQDQSWQNPSLFGRLVFWFAPSKSDPNLLAPDSLTGQIYFAPVGAVITLDGDLNDWENVPRALVDSYQPGPGAESYEFAVAADDANLYFMADVIDANVLYQETDWWQEDGVELLLNATGDLGLEAYQPGVVQIGILAGNAINPDAGYGGGNSGDAQVSFAVVETDTGYVVEASVPLVTDVWEIVPEHMGVLGFNTGLNGNSGEGRDTKLIWSAADVSDQSWQNPSVFGQLVFWDPDQ